jgi:glycosidase
VNKKWCRLFVLLIFVLAACNSGQVESGTAIETVTPAGIVTITAYTTLLIPTETPVSSSTPTQLPELIPYTTPDWFQDGVLYEIFVRSFRDSDGDGVGDLQGVTEHLDYVESLGATTIWLMPVFPSPSQHGYDITDYFDVNPDYGTQADLQELVEAAHERDIRVILDFVPSHLSDQHPIFQDAYGNPESEYSDWFVWTNDTHTQYASFAGNREMPRFNHYNEEVVDYLIQVALYWLDLDGDGDYTDGVDGFRVDNATFPPQEFFINLRQGVKLVNPRALLLGETWVNNPVDLSRFYEDQFDALFDFPLYQQMQSNRDFNGDGLLAGEGFPALLTTLFNEQEDHFPPEAIAVRFLSNHDTNRIFSEVGGDPDRQRLAAALLAGLPGPVMVYYGEEIGMPGQKGGPPYWDNYRREPMDWYASEEGEGQTTWFHPDDRHNQLDDGISVEEQTIDPYSVLNAYRGALELRNGHAALREGDFTILDLTVSGVGPWGIVRTTPDAAVVALYNFALEKQEVTIETFPFSTSSLVDLLSGEQFPGSQVGEPYQIIMPPASALLLSSE